MLFVKRVKCILHRFLSVSLTTNTRADGDVTNKSDLIWSDLIWFK